MADSEVGSPPQEVISTTPCPSCLAAGKLNMLKNRAGRFETYCDGNHIWKDTEELNAAVAFAKKKNPEKFPAAQTPVQTETPKFFTVDPKTKTLIEQLAGQTINDAAELKGVIWTLVTQAKEAKEEASLARTKAVASAMKAKDAAQPVNPALAGDGQFVLSVPEVYTAAVEEYASYEQKSVQEYLQEQFVAFMESFYTIQAPRG